MDGIKEFINRNLRQYGMIIALVIIIVFFGFVTGGRLIWPRNVSMLVRQNAYVLILAIGMMFCILTGGNVDLSVGSLVALVSAMSGLMATTLGLPSGLAILISVLTGLLAGIWQGFWIAYVRVPPFIATLSGMLVFRGINNIILNGQTLPLSGLYVTIGTGSVPDIAPNTAPDFLRIGDLLQLQNKPEYLNMTMLVTGLALSIIYVLVVIFNRNSKKKRGYEVQPLSLVIVKIISFFIVINLFSYWLAMDDGLPIMLILLAALYAIYTFIATKTIPGRHIYAMGGNIKAAELSGVNTKKMMFLVYANMGLLSGVAAVVTAGRLMAASPNVGVSFELDAIGACFIGGASAYGGVGTIWGAVVGAFIMGVMNNGMSIIGLNVFLQSVAKGLVVLLAVAFDMYSKSKSRLG
ncbi:MAG: multiple monosaccharide ABC transporter permease [Acetivibrionales bacterium]|jgi:putative multiple sugar transport system permease protein|nr:sugar ABC transporter permease [Bacillota bacterium]NLP06591.1 sugar ABC transporter permease [Clostridiaceae bacterium]HOA54722.1 sugar ABC transporter permease [Clostridiales bacterium]